jgi:hypothetical protein
MPHKSPLTIQRRFLESFLLGWAILSIYMFINRHQSGSPYVLTMPSWVPFWPVMTLPYLSMLPMTALTPAFIQHTGRFRRSQLALLIAFLLVMPWWHFTPTVLPRLPADPVWWNAPYHWLIAIDRPYNVTPCAHGMGPVISAWFLLQERPRWRWPIISYLALCLPTIALTWQHRPQDILLGTVAAFLGIFCASKINLATS